MLLSSIFRAILEFGRVLASARLWSILATGLVLLALWGSFVSPDMTEWYFRSLVTVLVIVILIYILPKLPT